MSAVVVWSANWMQEVVVVVGRDRLIEPNYD